MANPSLAQLALSDHAVWQRDQPVTLEGVASPGAAVAAEFRGNRAAASADANGRWRLTLGPFAASEQGDGGVYRADDVRMSIAGQSREIRDVLVGDVWVCSGQSNMEMPLKDCEGGPGDALRARGDGMRLLIVNRTVADASHDVMQLPTDGWRRCTPETAGHFSAVGYWFGKRIHAATRVPIGLVQAAVGNTPGEAWTPIELLRSDPQFAPILARREQSRRDWPDSEKRYERAFAQWDHDADLAERQGRRIPGPFPKLVGPGSTWTPAGLFNGMIAPLTASPIKGVIWYQGAGAPDRAHQYRALFRGLIQHWRARWRLGDFPFLFVQEAAFGPRRDQPCEHSWAELREAQAMALTEPRTAMAVAIDTGGEGDIHPARKEPLGERLALAARATVYGENVPFSGPTLRAWRIEGPRVRLSFDQTYGALRPSDGPTITGFAVSPGASGADFESGHRHFVWAEARVEGDDILVSSPLVSAPAAVRYAWAQNPRCNLVNAAGLPASPFRTDDWPGVTVANF